MSEVIRCESCGFLILKAEPCPGCNPTPIVRRRKYNDQEVMPNEVGKNTSQSLGDAEKGAGTDEPASAPEAAGQMTLDLTEPTPQARC
jgi:hypothetical protein